MTLVRILKNALWLLSGEAVATLSGFLLSTIVARQFGVERFGEYSFVLSFVFLFAILADLGFSTIALRDVARDQSCAKDYVERGIGAKILLGCATAGIVVLAALLVAHGIRLHVIAIAAAYVAINSLNDFLRSIFRARQTMRYDAWLKAAERLAVFILGAVIVLRGYGLAPLLAVYLVASLSVLVVTIRILNRQLGRLRVRVDLAFARRMLQESIWLGIGAFFVTIYYSIDVTMLKLMTGNMAGIGLYSSAYRLLTLALGALSLLGIAFFPALAESAHERGGAAKVVADYYWIVVPTVALSVGFLEVFGPRILGLVYGPRYLSAAPILMILALSLLFVAAREPRLYLMIAQGDQKTYALIVGAAAAVNVVLNLLLIPGYQTLGAAGATVAAEFVVMVLVLWRTSARKGIEQAARVAGVSSR